MDDVESCKEQFSLPSSSPNDEHLDDEPDSVSLTDVDTQYFFTIHATLNIFLLHFTPATDTINQNTS